ncbi:MFS transporter [Salipiger sp.]|uniref:MFS transporter n=1 Tax=Salipiger sp. TaxID=2078585 RepID=UPI003A96D81A
MRLPLSFAALVLSTILLQLSSGTVAPLDALAGIGAGFSTTQIGLLGSAHYLGFFAGCWWTPRLLGSIGPSRAYAAFTALGAIGLLAHTLVNDPYAWAVFRMATGVCVAGCYTVIEAWLQADVTNESRGRAMGIYRVADLGTALVAQLLIGVLDPQSYVSYNLLAMVCCAALLPLTLTTSRPPVMPATPRLEPGLAWRISPLAVAGVLTSALSGASFRMVGPIYGQEVGLSADRIAVFLAAYVAGGAAAQFPVGWLADRYDRRHVLIGLSAAAIAACTATALMSDASPGTIYALAAFFGVTTFPIYSISASHAHDFAESGQRVALSAALMFWFAVGAIAAPYAASVLLGRYGPPALFILIGIGHVGLIVFGLARMQARPTTDDRTPYVYAPRTSFLVGRLLGRFRDR